MLVSLPGLAAQVPMYAALFAVSTNDCLQLVSVPRAGGGVGGGDATFAGSGSGGNPNHHQHPGTARWDGPSEARVWNPVARTL